MKEDKSFLAFIAFFFDQFERDCDFLGSSTDKTYFHADHRFKNPRSTGERCHAHVWGNRLPFPSKNNITLVESTYPSQRPQCPSLSPYFLFVGTHCHLMRQHEQKQNLHFCSTYRETKSTFNVILGKISARRKMKVSSLCLNNFVILITWKNHVSA